MKRSVAQRNWPHLTDLILTKQRIGRLAGGKCHQFVDGCLRDTDDDDRLLSSGGNLQENLYAIGPVARGRLWEVTAVPEIRQQAALLSRRITLPEVGYEVAYTI